MAKGHVSTKMTLGLLLRSEPANTGITYTITETVSHCNLSKTYLAPNLCSVLNNYMGISAVTFQ